MRFFCLVTLLILTTPLSMSQPVPCSEREKSSQLDFWVGEWDLTWPGGQGGTPEGESGRGTNTITRELDGCVIHERFVAENGFEGESVSVYHPEAGWRQTWVDNQGSYLPFTGGLTEDGTMEFRMAPRTNPQGQEQINRMTWRNVTAGAFDWHWQRSLDDGATWEDVWVIRYTRR